MQYWLVKSEPSCYSSYDLKRDKKTHWDGVRNYQARNFMRTMRKGDAVLFYHSSTTPPAVVGRAEVITEAYPDHTQWDSKSDHFDHKSTKEKPLWDMVDISFQKKYTHPIPLATLRKARELEKMYILQKGNRLSVTPLSQKEFTRIETLGNHGI